MSGFEVPRWMDWLGGLVEDHHRAFVRLSNLETRCLADRLAGRPPVAPIYVSGLARAGTTILLEALARHPEVGTHQYRDYPFVMLPYAWTWLLRFLETREAAPVERAHGDRIFVTARSPEAMEESLWRIFFPAPARPGAGDVLDADQEHPAFERFYRNHIAKLLLARGARRYLAKGNYHVTRLGYLRRIFPDARFVVPVRAPEGHVISLLRQHRRFSAGLRDNPRGRAHLRRIGHFEFGPDRRPIDVGEGAAESIAHLWSTGEEVRGWARAWAQVYGHIADRLARDPATAAAARVTRYEDFCAGPHEELAAVFAHVGLDPPPGMIARFAAGVSAPDYYEAGLGDADRAIIHEETAAVARRFGYA
ncbi:MAG: sulfotransferase [Minicystis sp.]